MTNPGRLADNVLHFARVLREAGLPVGTDRVQLALQALQLGGIPERRDFHDVLQACLIARHEHQPLFDQAFELFWRDPDLAGRMMAMLLPQVQAQAGLLQQRENRRLAEAFYLRLHLRQRRGGGTEAQARYAGAPRAAIPGPAAT